MYLFGAVMTAVIAYPLFAALDRGAATPIALMVVAAFTLSHGAMYAPQAAFMSELFDARVRYSGASLGAQLASVFAGGLAPFVGTVTDEVVIEERRRQLFSEGHRYVDMLRKKLPFQTGTNRKGQTYSDLTCIPLPDVEVLNNPNF